MRHNTSNRRTRGRNNRGGNSKGQGNNRAKVFDSNGPEVRIRGTAFQICEKYETLAKDARSTGDVVLAESYMQHAEHYQRMIVTWDEQAENNNNKQQNENTYKQDKKSNQNDDLSLPNSILGDEVKVKEQASNEKVLETA